MIAGAQRADAELAPMIQLLEDPDIVVDTDKLKEDSVLRIYYAQRQLLTLKANVLYRRWVSPDGLSEKLLVVAPRVMRETTLSASSSRIWRRSPGTQEDQGQT